jgi:hypothetical protein
MKFIKIVISRYHIITSSGLSKPIAGEMVKRGGRGRTC